MKRFTIAGVLVVLMVGSLVLADDKALKDLEGTYKVTTAEKGGKSILDDTKGKVTITFKEDKMTIDFDGKDTKSAKIKVDATKKPAHIDITLADGPEKDKTFPGIYQLEKGELMIAFNEKDGDRPKEFKSEGNAMVLKMKKDEKK